MLSVDVLILQAQKYQPGARHNGKEQMNRDTYTPAAIRGAVGTAIELIRNTTFISRCLDASKWLITHPVIVPPRLAAVVMSMALEAETKPMPSAIFHL